MGRSNALRLADVRDAFRLLGDCRDAGRILAGWYPLALAGLGRLTGSAVTIGGVIRWGAEPLDPGRNVWDIGWATARDRAVWLEIMTGPRVREHLTPIRSQQVRAGHILRSRRQLVPDREWERSVERDDRRSVGQDETVISQHWVRPGVVQIFSLNRASEDGQLTLRQRRLVGLFHREAIRLFGTALAVADDPFTTLPPRLREVLAALAEGDSEKQVAARLGLSRHTVHEYVAGLYRRFAVRSRAELMAVYWRLRGGTTGA